MKQERAKFRKNRNHGMALIFVLGALIAFFVIAFYLYSFSTNQRYQSHFLSSGEIASQVAEFGAKQAYSMLYNAIEFLNSTNPDTFPKRATGLKKSPDGIKEFFEIFVDENDRLSEREQSALISIPLAESTIFKDLTHTPNLTVTITLQGQKSIYQQGLIPGCSDQSGETTGKFIIDSLAEYNNVKRRVISVVEQRTIQMTMPVLSRFTLSLLETPDKDHLNPNAISANGTTPETFTDPKYLPLVILGGQPYSNSTDTDPAPFLDKQGWVFILPELHIGLAPGSGKYGEHFLLAGESTFFREIKKDYGPFGSRFGVVLNKTFEMWNTHQIYTRLTGLYNETREEDAYYFLSNIPAIDNVQKSSIFRFMGTPLNQSPTLVFGNVTRSYILEEGLQKKSNLSPTNCAVLPYVSKEKFYTYSWTAGMDSNSLKVLKETCNNDWEIYRQAMSTPVFNVPYNEGLAFCFDSQGYTGNANPRPIQPTFATNKISKLGKYLNYDAKQPEKFLLDENINLYRDEKQVFSGDLSKVLSYLGNYCIARCSRQFETSQALKKYLQEMQSSGKNPTGFYLVKNSFEWTDDWNRLAVGGIGLVCEKGITITARVEPTPSKALAKDCAFNPIYFVSLTGDITINTGERIKAALIAPNGEIHSSKTMGMNICGFVATKAMKLSELCNSASKIIQYDLDYDWADSKSYQKGFRTSLEYQPIMFFAKPN